MPTSSSSSIKDIQQWALEVIEIEARAIAELNHFIDEQFAKAVQHILESKGKVVVCGMGKSGLVGKKIAATLASTGTPSFFVHPAEAFHGDLGMIAPQDILILISNSGETNEVLQIIPFFKDNGNLLIGMTGNPASTLGKHVDFHLCVKVRQEACPLDLAPTSSTTATLVMGDALAVALMHARNFQPENFARFHPGGSLGRKLLGKVGNVMSNQNLPTISPKANGMALIDVISKGRLGLAVVVDETQKVLGIITDGDLRRSMQRLKEGFFQIQAQGIMTPQPITVPAEMSLSAAEKLMLDKKITSLIVATNHELKGIVQIYDL